VENSVSIIICAYSSERWPDLAAAVASAREQDAPAHEIIVVIDHNEDLLARAHAHFEAVTVIGNQLMRGLSGARNSGIAVARGDIIAFLDDDAQASHDWVAQIRSPYADPSIVGVGGAIEPLWSVTRPRWFPTEFDWVVGCTYRGHRIQSGPVRNLIGANMSFRRSIFGTIGGFRDGVGQVGTSMLRCDDTEFCIRVHQAIPEAILLYEPCAKVYHRVPSSRARWAYFRTRCYTEGVAKALVARLVGGDDALSSERSYSLRALPRAVVRGGIDTLFRGDPLGLARSGAVIIGFGLTAAGYFTTSLGKRVRRGGKDASTASVE
jgi:GT2 family glycosyltransferase